ncbi:MAG TPA: MBOAT family O-acyltransferase [Chroococcales cyanobacterium]
MPTTRRIYVLIAASYVFYAFFSVPVLALIIGTSAIDYLVSKKICIEQSKLKRQALLAVALAVNLSVLTYFKYANCLIALQHTLKQWIGISGSEPRYLSVVLPIGLSFYTFEAISYLVDVYRGAKPARTWWHYSFFIMWFPHLVAGPIVRYSQLRKQFENGIPRAPRETARYGLKLILAGLMLKLLVADSVAPYAEQYFQDPSHGTSLLALSACIAAGARLYFDLWGYSQLARGISELFNIHLPPNFNHPLLARNSAEFWQRWHISLSTWLRDYVFLPTGGRSRTSYKVAFSLMLTMLIAALWHGAGISFLVWGVMCGLVQVAYHQYRRLKRLLKQDSGLDPTNNPLYKFTGWLLIFTGFNFGAALFHTHSWAQIVALTKKLAEPLPAENYVLSTGLITLASALLYYSVALVLPSAMAFYHRWVSKLPYWIKIQAVVYAIGLCCIFSATTPRHFIYVQF